MRRTGWTTLAATIAVIALAGCGDGTTSSTSTTARGTVDPAALKEVSRASARLTDAGSAHFTLDGRFTVQDEDVPVHSSGDMTTAGVPRGTLDMAILVPGPDGKPTPIRTEARIIGYKMYMRVPEEALEDPARPWQSMTLPPAAIQASDPSFQARAMRYATEARKVGTEKVGGVRTTRYRVTVDYGALAKSGPAAIRKVAEAVTATGVPKQTSEVWIDRAGIPRRLKADVATKTNAADSAIDIRIDHLGVPVHVEAPPADRVSDAGLLGTNPA